MVRYLTGGDTALVVEFGDKVDRHISAQVLALSRRIEAAGLDGVVETVPTFRSVMVHYNPLVTSNATLRERIAPMIASLDAVAPEAGRLWVLPICCDPQFALDVPEMAERTGLTPARVVELFTSTIFNVYMLGFLPGHPYLGDAPPELNLPRRASPRVKVPPGSVATAVGLAVIYPLETPGGWHIVGRTPVRVYDRRRPKPVFFAPNDKIRFDPVSLAEHDELEARWQEAPIPIEPQPVPAETAP